MTAKPHPDFTDTAADLDARLARFDEAGRIFDRMLWLNPSDNRGARFLIDPVAAREPWEEE